MDLSAAPIAGEYVAASAVGSAGGWLVPNATRCGAGPVSYLGTFDTRPGGRVDELARELKAVPSPGGLTLRFTLPRAGLGTEASAGPFGTTYAPDVRAPVGLMLVLAGFDVGPGARQQVQSWPGVPPGHNPWGDGFPLGDGNASWARPICSAFAGRAVGTRGYDWLVRKLARPRLDLLPYCGGVWSQADLVELAGGARYVSAWLQVVWSRVLDVDPLASSSWRVPWVLEAGAPRRVCHETAWHCTFPVSVNPNGVAAALEADTLTATDATRYQVAAPFAGRWDVAGCANTIADELWIGLETRNGMALARETVASVGEPARLVWPGLADGPLAGPAAVVGVGGANGGNTQGIVSVSVVRS